MTEKEKALSQYPQDRKQAMAMVFRLIYGPPATPADFPGTDPAIAQDLIDTYRKVWGQNETLEEDLSHDHQ